jgi:hypothetical protein
MKCLKLVGLTLLVLIVGSSAAVAGDDQYSRATLAGIRGVGVLVENPVSGAKEMGLTATIIQTDVELKLRLAGIPVLTLDEALKEPGVPLLYISPHVLIKENDNLWAADVSVELTQNVRLERDSTNANLVPTWYRSMLFNGKTGTLSQLQHEIPEQIRSGIKDLVDVFINAYLAMNPRTNADSTSPVRAKSLQY